MREGSAETKEQAAKALWMISLDNLGNKGTVGKFGGIEPLVGLLVNGDSAKSSVNAAGALASLSSKHTDNRTAIAKRLVSVLNSKSPERAARVLGAMKSICDSAANKTAIAKAGGIPPTIAWLGTEATETDAAHAVVALAEDNITCQALLVKLGGIPPLIQVIAHAKTPKACENAACALWHLGCNPDSQNAIAEAGGILPLVSMLSLESERAQELAAVVIVRLARGNARVSEQIAEVGGIPPLIKLMAGGTLYAQQQAVLSISELALLPDNRDEIAVHQGVPHLIDLLRCPTQGTAELAARAIGRVARHNKVGIRTTDQQETTGRTTSESISDVAALATAKDIIGKLEEENRLAREAAARQAQFDAFNTPGVASSDDETGSNGDESSGDDDRDASHTDVAGVGDVAIRDAEASAVVSNDSKQDATLGTSTPEARMARRAAMRGGAGGDAAPVPEVSERPSISSGASAVPEVGRRPSCSKRKSKGKYSTSERRAAVLAGGGIHLLIEMLAGREGSMHTRGQRPTMFKDGEARLMWAKAVEAAVMQKDAQGNVPDTPLAGLPLVGSEQLDMMVEAAGALCELADGDVAMQDAIIRSGGVMPLLALFRSSHELAQEHAASCVGHLCQEYRNQKTLCAQGILGEVVTLLKHGSPNAQAAAAAGLAELARGGVLERQTRGLGATDMADRGVGPDDRLVAIAEAGALPPLIAMLSSGILLGKEKAAACLWHLALDEGNMNAIARANSGIPPIVALLDSNSATEQTYEFAASALTRLSLNDAENQTQIAKRLVAQLSAGSAGAQERSARAIWNLAADQAESPVVILNAGALLPLVRMLSSGAGEARRAASGALSTLAKSSQQAQQAIAAGLVGILGSDAEASEQVTQLLLELAGESTNRIAIAETGAVQKLVVQLRSKRAKSRDLASATLAQLTADESCGSASVAECVAAGGVKALIGLLANSGAKMHAAEVLGHICHHSPDSCETIICAEGVEPLVKMLSDVQTNEAKLVAARVLRSLTAASEGAQAAIAAAGAMLPVIALMREGEPIEAQVQAAGLVCSILLGHRAFQDEFVATDGLSELVGLLIRGCATVSQLSIAHTYHEACTHAARALCELALAEPANQGNIADKGAIKPLITLLLSPDNASSHQSDGILAAKEAAARALGALARDHAVNQAAIARAGGISPLVSLLGSGSMLVEKSSIEALAALSTGNVDNEVAIATMLVGLLQDQSSQAIERAARAISRLATSSTSSQIALGKANAIPPLTSLLATGVGANGPRAQKELAGAVWSMAQDNSPHQHALVEQDAVPALIAMLSGDASLYREAAGALAALAADSCETQQLIADRGGVLPLVALLSHDGAAQDVAAAAIAHLATATEGLRKMISDAGSIPALVDLLASQSSDARTSATHALQSLVLDSPSNQAAVAEQLVRMFDNGIASGEAHEHATRLICNLCSDLSTLSTRCFSANCSAMATAGAIPRLIQQVQAGTEISQALGAEALVLMAVDTEKRVEISRQLVELLSVDSVSVRQRAGRALRQVIEEANHEAQKALAIRAGLVSTLKLLQGGVQEGHLEAQEHALWSLSFMMPDAPSRAGLVAEGGIAIFVDCLIHHAKLSVPAQENVTLLLSCIALDSVAHAESILCAGAAQPLVALLSSHISANTSRHAAKTLALLAKTSKAGQGKVVQAGAISPLALCLKKPSAGDETIEVSDGGGIGSSESIALLSVKALDSLCHGSPAATAQLMASSEVIPSLLAMIAAEGIPMPPRLAAAKLLATLAETSSRVGETVDVEGGMAVLVELLSDVSADELLQEVSRLLLLLSKSSSQSQAAVANAGAIPPLVGLMTQGTSATTQHHAVCAIESLALNSSENCAALAKAKALAPLVSLLTCERDETRERARCTLIYLASHDESRGRAVARRLVALLEGADTSGASARAKSPAIASACSALGTLAARDITIHNAIMQAGALSSIVRLLSEGPKPDVSCELVATAASSALCHLVRSDETLEQLVSLGGVSPLVTLLTGESKIAQTNAASMLCRLCADSDDRAAIVREGGIPGFVTLLSSGEQEARRHAVVALEQLSVATNAREMIEQAGAIAPLVSIVATLRIEEAQEAAAVILSELARSTEGAKQAIVAAGGVRVLVDALDEDVSDGLQRHAAAVFWALTDGSSNSTTIPILLREGVAPLLLALLSSDSRASLDAQGYACATLKALATTEMGCTVILQVDGAIELLDQYYVGSSDGASDRHQSSSWLKEQCGEIVRLLRPTPLADESTAASIHVSS